MSFNLKLLKPKPISDEEVCDFLLKSDGKTFQPPNLSEDNFCKFSALDRKDGLFAACAILLTSAKYFDAQIRENPPVFVENNSDLNFTSVSVGKQQYEEYRNALKNSNDLLYAFISIHDYGELTNFFQKQSFTSLNITSISEFLKTMIAQIDVAFSWMCYLLNKDPSLKIDSILFQEKNPLVPLFSGIRPCLKTPEPFHHIYTVKDSSEFQKSLLESTNENVFIRNPKLLVFCGDENSPITGELPPFVVLPMKLNKTALSSVIERIRAWEQFDSEEANEVISKYKQTFDLAYFELVGYVNSSDEKYQVVTKNPGESRYRHSKQAISSELSPVCVVYQLIEQNSE